MELYIETQMHLRPTDDVNSLHNEIIPWKIRIETWHCIPLNLITVGYMLIPFLKEQNDAEFVCRNFMTWFRGNTNITYT